MQEHCRLQLWINNSFQYIDITLRNVVMDQDQFKSEYKFANISQYHNEC